MPRAAGCERRPPKVLWAQGRQDRAQLIWRQAIKQQTAAMHFRWKTLKRHKVTP